MEDEIWLQAIIGGGVLMDQGIDLSALAKKEELVWRIKRTVGWALLPG